MQAVAALQPEHETSIRVWERSAPWYSRITMRFGLQRKLLLCFMAVFVAAMGLTCFIFNEEMHDQLSDVLGEQAREVATALSWTSQDAIRGNNWEELNRRGQQLILGRDIVYIAFLDASAHPKTLASRDVELGLGDLTFGQQSVMQVRQHNSPAIGQYVEVVAPIIGMPQNESREHSQHLLGYVAVGLSQVREEAQLQRAQYLVIFIASVMVLLAFPVASLLIHRVFMPIRKLVAATQRITAGDLEVRTEIHRPDEIGDLSRSFDEMTTRVKKQQEALAEANHSLERKVQQRTAQLETANARLSNEIIEKESFLRAISHDLNAPLRNIGGMASMLLMKHRDYLDEETIHRLTRIKSNVDLESGLIAELLELSRIKTRRQKMEPVNVAAMVGELRDLFDNDLRSESIQLIVDTPLPVLHAERTRIRQIFQNLFDNAIKYMGTGATRQINVGCVMHPTEIEFYVRDSGVGIDPVDAEKIFFVFRRGKSRTTQTIAGKGVGLAVVKSIIETYNGKIWVTAAPGQGSTFRFTINGKFLAQPFDGEHGSEQAA